MERRMDRKMHRKCQALSNLLIKSARHMDRELREQSGSISYQSIQAHRMRKQTIFVCEWQEKD